MHTNNLPVIAKDDKVAEAIIEISKARLGISVVMEGTKILGVITDGDVRRAMQTKQNAFFTLKAKDIMSDSPKCIRETAKLSEAEAMFLKYGIHTLLVVNDEGLLTGIIDSFSCL